MDIHLQRSSAQKYGKTTIKSLEELPVIRLQSCLKTLAQAITKVCGYTYRKITDMHVRTCMLEKNEQRCCNSTGEYYCFKSIACAGLSHHYNPTRTPVNLNPPQIQTGQDFKLECWHAWSRVADPRTRFLHRVFQRCCCFRFHL